MLTGLGILARADWAGTPAAALGEALIAFERAESLLTAARSAILVAFNTQRGFEDDGQASARAWLTWQARITRSAATTAITWSRRLGQHPVLADALAAGRLSASWAKQLADWTDLLPEQARDEADTILVAAAAAGADLAGLGRLAEEIRRATARPDADGPGVDDGFEDRAVYLATTLGGAGRMSGDLTARCAAALAAVLDALSKKAGPEDTRTIAQRRHDALEEACRRLLAASCLPDRAGQPSRLNLQLTLDQLLNGLDAHPANDASTGASDGPGAAGPAGSAGSAGAAGPAGPEPGGWPSSAPAGPGDDCDAALAPVVTGRIDHDLLDSLTAKMVPSSPLWAAFHLDQAGLPCEQCGHTPPATRPGRSGRSGRPARNTGTAGPGRAGSGVTAAGAASDEDAEAEAERRELGRRAARRLLLETAVALLSGPEGLASLLRTGTLPPPAASISLPLDIGAATELVPPHLRKAIILRDKHCAAPGCTQPPAACHVHHIVPRSKGGTTSLGNCVLL